MTSRLAWCASVLLLSSLAACLASCEETTTLADDERKPTAPGRSVDAAVAVDRGGKVDVPNVSADPEQTGATLRASKRQVCPGECVELLATPGTGEGAVSYRWANELTQGAGPVQVCPLESTTYQVTIRHEEAPLGEFVVPASELSRSVTVSVAGDCQVSAQPPEIHESAREVCRARFPIVDTSGYPEAEVTGVVTGVPGEPSSAVRLLPSGGMRVAGAFRGKFESQSGPLELVSSGLSSFIIELDAECQVVSAVQLAQQGKATIQLSALAIDSMGNSVIAGWIGPDKYDFGNGLVLAGGWSAHDGAFVASLDSRGRARWARRLSGVLMLANLRLDGEDNVVVATQSNSYGVEPAPGLDLGGGPVVAESDDWLLTKLGRDGEHRWTKIIPSENERMGIDVATDGRIAVGLATSSVDQSGLPSSTTTTLLDPDGKELWRHAEPLSDTTLDGRIAVSLSVGGRVVRRTEQFSYEPSQSRVVTAVFDIEGRPVWRHEQGADQAVFAAQGSVAADRWGNVASTSTFRGSLRFGASTLEAPSEDREDVYVDLLDASGKPRWAVALDIRNNAMLSGLDSDDAGNVVVAAVGNYPTSELVVLKLAQ